MLHVLLEVIDCMIIIVQYAKLEVTKLKSREINTADCCYISVIN